jgi:hypothetical protein
MTAIGHSVYLTRVVDAAPVHDEMLDLAIVVVGDLLQRVEVGLDDPGHQRLLLPTLGDVDIELNGHRRRVGKPVASELLHLTTRIGLERGLAVRESRALLRVVRLAQQHLGLDEHDHLGRQQVEVALNRLKPVRVDQ